MQLTDLIQNIYSDLGQTDSNIGSFTATGGSATTFVNTDWGNLESPPEEDALKNRVAFVQSTTDGLSPQGKWGKVSAYVESTYTATIATVTDAIESGDTILLPKQDLFPLNEVINRINRALQNLGDIPVPDTSLTSESNKTEYALPVAAKRGLISVFYQTETGDSDDNYWDEVSGWKMHPTAGGSTGLLILPQLPQPRTIKLVYMGLHPRVSAYSDYISEYVHPKIVTAAACVELLAWYNNKDENQGANEYYVWLMTQKQQEMTQAKAEFPIWRPRRTPRYFTTDIPYERTKDPATNI